MARAIALLHGFDVFAPANLLRAALVYGCAMTLIAAGSFIPVFTL
jgi:hypothetical protein